MDQPAEPLGNRYRQRFKVVSYISFSFSKLLGAITSTGDVSGSRLIRRAKLPPHQTTWLASHQTFVSCCISLLEVALRHSRMTVIPNCRPGKQTAVKRIHVSREPGRANDEFAKL